MKNLPYFEKRLKALQLELINKLAKIKQNVIAPANSDWNEQAQERENDEVIDALGNEVKRELNLVNNSLYRIKQGDYLNCDDCGEEINRLRLSVLPYTSYCITCAQKRDL